MIDTFATHPYARFFRGVLESFDYTAINTLNHASAFPEHALVRSAKLDLRVRHVNIPVGIVGRTLLDMLPALNESPMFRSFEAFWGTTDGTVFTSPPMTVFRTHITS